MVVNAGIDCRELPLNPRLPAVALNIPLLRRLPYISSVPPAPTVIDAPLLIAIFLAVPRPAVSKGIFGAVDGMIISVDVVGIPPHQLPAVFQSELIVPLQVPGAETASVATFDVTVPQVPVTATS
jgi:hypothetical protein